VGASDQEIRDIARKVGAQVSREINRTTSSGMRA
jgi:bacterioferritin-associated ferredoxin